MPTPDRDIIQSTFICETKDLELPPDIAAKLAELNDFDQYFGLFLKTLEDGLSKFRDEQEKLIVNMAKRMKLTYEPPTQNPSYIQKKRRKRSFGSLEEKVQDELQQYLRDTAWDDYVDEEENPEIVPQLIVPHCSQFFKYGEVNAKFFATNYKV